MPRGSGFSDEERARSRANKPGTQVNTPTGKKAAKEAAEASVAAGTWKTGTERARYCATVKRDGEQCRKAPLRYGIHCMFHAGSRGSRTRQLQVREEIALTVAALNELGIAPVMRDPREVLLEQVYSASAMALALQGLVRDLDDTHLRGIGDLDFQPTADGTVVPIPDRKGSIAEARLTLYGAWMDRAARVAKMALDAGVEERLVRLAENQATLIVRTLRAVLSQLDLSPAQLAKAQELAASEFRLLAARPVPALATSSEPTTQKVRPTRTGTE